MFENNKKIQLDVNPKMTIKEAKKKSGHNPDIYWKYGNKLLNNDETILSYGIEEDDCITCFFPINLNIGGYSLKTIDVSKNQIRTLDFDDNSPKYRSVGLGLSIQSICTNECEAKNKIVFKTIGFVENYNLLSKLDITCPVCNKTIYPINFGFLHCKYEIDFIKWEKNKKESGSISSVAYDEFKIFSENSGISNFIRLVFNVTSF